VRDVLVAIDWHGYFETVATPADLGVDAASPAIVRAALSSMGVLPSAAAVVVDDPAAASGAHSAGAHVCVVGDQPLPTPARSDRAVLQVATFADVPDALRGIGDGA
jgi:beta-phosphoglucomutase-like phosphatase (HAD superfamily)